jgi:hypothetical protein
LNPFVESDLSVALAKLRAARRLMEDNALAAVPSDAATLRSVMSLVMDASGPVAGALAVLRMEDELRVTLEKAPTERPAPMLTVVR